jgi:hypothetical protein
MWRSFRLSKVVREMSSDRVFRCRCGIECCRVPLRIVMRGVPFTVRVPGHVLRRHLPTEVRGMAGAPLHAFNFKYCLFITMICYWITLNIQT